MGNLADGGAVFGFGCHRIELECLMAAMTEGIVLRVLKRLTVAAPFMRVRPPRPTAMVLWTFYFLYYCCPSLSCHAIGLNWSDVLSLTRFAHTRNIVLPIEGFSLWHAICCRKCGWMNAQQQFEENIRFARPRKNDEFTSVHSPPGYCFGTIAIA